MYLVTESQMNIFLSSYDQMNQWLMVPMDEIWLTGNGIASGWVWRNMELIFRLITVTEKTPCWKMERWKKSPWLSNSWFVGLFVGFFNREAIMLFFSIQMHPFV